MKEYQVRLENLDGDTVEEEFYQSLDSAKKSFDGEWRNSHVEPLSLFMFEIDTETEELTTLDARVIAGVNEASELLREDVLDRLEVLYGKPISYKYFSNSNGDTIRVADHSGNPDKNGRVDLDVVICDFDFSAEKFNSTTKGLQFSSKNTVEEIIAAITARVTPDSE